jgi:hypothetical protein
MSKQADYDAQQARLDAERQAAANQSYANAQAAAQSQANTQAMVNNIVAAFQPKAPASSASAPTSSASSPSDGGGCHLTPADRAAGLVCTAN